MCGKKKAMAILHRVTNKKERDCNPQKRIWRRRWDRGLIIVCVGRQKDAGVRLRRIIVY